MTTIRVLVLFVLFTVIVLPFQAAHAGSPIVALGSSLTFEYGNDGRSYETKQPLAARAGYSFNAADLYLEYSNYQESDGSGAVSVARNHQEWLAWARRIVMPKWKVKPYVALGAGLQYDVVSTSFMGENSTDQGNPNALYAAAIGFEIRLYQALAMQIESRLEFSSNYAPDPSPSASVFLGWRF